MIVTTIPAADPDSSNKKWVWIVLLLVLLGGTGAVVWWKLMKNGGGPAPGPSPGGSPPPDPPPKADDGFTKDPYEGYIYFDSPSAYSPSAPADLWVVPTQTVAATDETSCLTKAKSELFSHLNLKQWPDTNTNNWSSIEWDSTGPTCKYRTFNGQYQLSGSGEYLDSWCITQDAPDQSDKKIYINYADRTGSVSVFCQT